MFSKSCEYAIRATILLAIKSTTGLISLANIAKAIGTPKAYTSKILQALVNHNIINSVKGKSGGYFIETKNLSKILLIHIVEAIDGDKVYNGCALGLKECSNNNPCPLHDAFKNIRLDLKQMLENTSLTSLVDEKNPYAKIFDYIRFQ